MEKKKTKKINLKTLIIIIMVIIILELFFILFLHVIKKANEQKISTNIEFEYKEIEYYLRNYDYGFLESWPNDSIKINDNSRNLKHYYKVFDNYFDYEKFINSIDEWSQDRLESQKQEIYYIMEETKDYAEYGEGYVDDYMESYRESVEKRTKKIKDAFSTLNIDENFFDNNSLIVIEYHILGSALKNNLKGVNVDGEKIDFDFKGYTSGNVSGGISKMYFFKIPKRYLENVKEYNVNWLKEQKK